MTASIRIVEDNCIGCGQCLEACPFAAIEMRGEEQSSQKAAILPNCTLCGSCVGACAFAAIDLRQDSRPAGDIADCNGIWVYCEQFQGNLRPVALELLGQGRRLADQLGCELTAILLGAHVEQHSGSLISHGADTVLLVQENFLAELNDLAYTDVMVQLVQTYKPAIMLLGATSFGRSFAPRVAARLQTGLTADCTRLDIDVEQGLLLQTRPAFGGNLMATIITPVQRPQMATVRPKVFAPLAADASRQGQIIRARVSPPTQTLVQLLGMEKSQGDRVNIVEADILIAVGRGIGNAKNIALAEELAQLLGGAVAVSRAVVDSGWYGYSHQVGQTGKTVAPKLYIACGISGAVQHVAGIAAETIVAVNNDPDAPIFSYAHYAVPGDCVDFLTSMIELIKSNNLRAV